VFLKKAIKLTGRNLFHGLNGFHQMVKISNKAKNILTGAKRMLGTFITGD
jgi:hypothetical protein